MEGKFEFRKDYVERQLAFSTNKNTITERDRGNINIDPYLDLNKIQLLSYLTGKQLDLSILKVCFFTNNTSPMLNNSYKSVIKIDELEYQLGLNSKICHPYDPKKESINYNWVSTYETEPEFISTLNEIVLDYSNIAIKFNIRNLIIIFSLLIISYWAIIILVLKVITYFVKGFQFN